MTQDPNHPQDPPGPDAASPSVPGAPGGAPDDEPGDEPGDKPTRAGYVTLLGRPNAGKSTLMNAVVGSRLSIVTPRAQTTWQRVTGIYTDDRVQMIFLDTPGLLEVKDLLQRTMLAEAHGAIREADVLLLVLDATRDLDDRTETAVREGLAEGNAPLLAAVNKIDEATPERVDDLARWVTDELGSTPYRVSALTGEGVDDLRDAVSRSLPPGPFLYPEDDIASQPVRFFVAELVRETLFEQFRQEIPYSTFCVVEAFREEQDPVYIGITIYVERESQKGIVVGKGGRAIRALGQEARRRIEHFIGQQVYLDLWVKALPGWRRRRAHLSRLGFNVPQEDEG